MPSGAGLNRVAQPGGKVLLQCSGDGTHDSGAVMLEAIGFTKWTFQLKSFTSAAPSGWTVTVYGTIDYVPYDENNLTIQFGKAAPNRSDWVAMDPNNWVPIPSPSVEGTSPDAFAWHNPLTAAGQALYSSAPWAAIRVVAVGSSTNGTGIQVLGFAVP